MPEALPSSSALGELAVTLAEGAADVARAGRADAFSVTSKSTDTDLVTEVDRRTERWLVGEIARARPDDGVLGEEGGGRDGTSGVRWVLDPIDGTVNFVLGIPHYAVSVAAEVTRPDGTRAVVAGAVCDVALGETFCAVLGAGAYLGDERLFGGRAVTLPQAVLGTGFGYDHALRTRQADAVALLLPHVADIRRLGSAALALCYVGAGRLDGYYESGLHPWDHAAGALVAAEAGCAVGGIEGEWLSGKLVVACAPSLDEPLRELLGRTGAADVLPDAPD